MISYNHGIMPGCDCVKENLWCKPDGEPFRHLALRRPFCRGTRRMELSSLNVNEEYVDFVLKSEYEDPDKYGVVNNSRFLIQVENQMRKVGKALLSLPQTDLFLTIEL
jgi:hypothetical protein